MSTKEISARIAQAATTLRNGSMKTVYNHRQEVKAQASWGSAMRR